ncbi:MAG: hypothetical protein F6K14_00440 [Symploca sp. SIO2C1]|nr:hypothetical protein [Symploca sp. SIO2C1]
MADFTENGTTFPPVTHIEQGEKAFSTLDNPTLSPGKQLQALVNRDTYLKGYAEGIATALGLVSAGAGQFQASALGLFAGLPLTPDGKLPPNKLLATDSAGQIVAIDKPVIQSAIASFATLKDRQPPSGAGGTGNTVDWINRDLNYLVTAGGTDNWIQLDTASKSFDLTEGSYLISAIATATMVDKHQIRIRREDGQVWEGLSTQTVSAASLVGQSLTTLSHVSESFEVPVGEVHKFAIQHRIFDTIPERSLGAEVGSGLAEVYVICDVFRVVYKEVSF